MTHMSLGQFGEQLLLTQDLDPMYVALSRMTGPDPTTLHNWLLAYWCFYHPGVASYIADAGDSVERYWDLMTQAAVNVEPAPTGGRWPRASERRHFRGKQALTAVDRLRATFPGGGGDAVQALYAGEPALASEVMRRVKLWYGFGDWIAFKVADMMETVLGYPLNFSNAEVLMFDSPAQAVTLWAEESGRPEAELFASYFPEQFSSRRLAPPKYARPLNIQEYETMLCKWKSYRNGHYTVGQDIRELRHALTVWSPFSPTARQLTYAMPKEVAA